MTQMIPFDAAPADGERTRTPVLVAAGLAAALALGGGGYFLLSGSEDPVATAPLSTGVTKTTRKAAPAVKKPVVKPAVKTVPVVAKTRLGRDPFRALYVEPAKASAAAPTSPTSTTPSTSTSGGSFAPSGGAGQEYPLRLESISREGAANSRTYFYTFTVGGVRKTVMQGQRFGKYGELVVLGYVANSKGAVIGAILQVGDDNPFGIALKEKISVQ
jgi:hypothetical protein